METWTWWPRGPLTPAEAMKLLELCWDDVDGLPGIVRALVETLRARER